MKKSIMYLLPAILFLLPACQREEVLPEDQGQTPGGPVMVSVTIDQGTRTTVSESSGLISFSSGDAIKIFNGSGIHIGVTASTSTSGQFSMEDGFSASGSGFAGFPASMIVDMTTAGVKFNLPDTYVFSEVGGTDIETSYAPCPMMGMVSGTGAIILQPACALIRFFVSDVKAGSLSFSFTTNVTGTTGAVPTLDGTSGITASGLSDAGKTITVTDVPEVGKTRYICITLPVPTGTKVQDIWVLNRLEDGTTLRSANITGSSSALARAGGHKLMVSSFTKIEAVDLGLSVKWANLNVGAGAVTGGGYYYAWGETEPKESYTWANYKWGPGWDYLTKYNSSDGKTMLDMSDDAARVNWKGGWRTPTKAEVDALLALPHEYVTDYAGTGVAGCKFTASNGNSIFLPAFGTNDYWPEKGFYWYSFGDKAGIASYLYFDTSGYASSGQGFSYSAGCPVRPVLP